jgi:hypothetical protein
MLDRNNVRSVIHSYLPLCYILTTTDIVTFWGCGYRRGMDWRINLLTTYTHHSQLQAILALSLISTLYKQNTLSLRQPTVFSSRSLATSDSGGSSASPVFTASPCRIQISGDNCQITPRLPAISHQPPTLLFTG